MNKLRELGAPAPGTHGWSKNTVRAMLNRPIYVGDLVSLYGRVTRIGTTSIAVHVETIVERNDRQEPLKVTEGCFVYVAIDDRGRPRPVPKD